MNRKNPSPGGGKSVAELVRKSNLFRDTYNPLRGLVISKAVTLLEAAERGDFAELQLVLRKIEKRYPILKGLKSRRLSAIEKLDWGIKTVDAEKMPAGATEAMAEAQQEYLRSRYEALTNLTEAIGQLVLAEFRGYSILQKHRYEDGPFAGAVRELHWLPQWCISRDGQFGDFFWNEASRFGIGLGTCASTLGEINRIGGEQLPRTDFVIRDFDGALYEIALIAFINWSMARKDYSAFVEVFGLPNSVVIMPPNIPQGKETDYQTAAERVADGTSGALPNGSDVKFPTSGVRGDAPFEKYCNAQNEDVVLAGTGGLLTMLAQPTGIGQGASGEHGDAFDDIAQADARKINEILQRDFDKVELEAKFPGQPVLAYFELCSIEEEDVQKICANVLTLTQAGYKVKAEVVEEKTGLELEDGDEAPEVPENETESATATTQTDTSAGQVSAALNVPAVADVQATALNGAQVTALAALAQQVANGLLPLATAQQIAVAAFPIVSASVISAIFTPLKTFTPESPATPDQSTKAVAEVTKLANRIRLPRRLRNRAPSQPEQIASAIADTLAPVLKRLDAIAKVEDPALQKSLLEKLLADFPALAEAIMADETLATTIAPQLQTALLAGLKGNPPA